MQQNSPARRFYEALSGAVIGQRTDRQFGMELRELAYGWPDLSRLID